MAVYGGYKGRQAVVDSITDDLRRILPNIIDSVRRFYGDPLAIQVRDLIMEI